MSKKKKQKIRLIFAINANDEEELEELIKNVIISGRLWIKEEDKFIGGGYDVKGQTRYIEYELDREDLEHMYHRWDRIN